MDDESNAQTNNDAQCDNKTDSPTSHGLGGESSVAELVQAHLDTFEELAGSDLPIAEDAEKAIALTDGGEDQ